MANALFNAPTAPNLTIASVARLEANGTTTIPYNVLNSATGTGLKLLSLTFSTGGHSATILNGGATGTFDYTRPANVSSNTVANYTVMDLMGRTATATITFISGATEPTTIVRYAETSENPISNGTIYNSIVQPIDLANVKVKSTAGFPLVLVDDNDGLATLTILNENGDYIYNSSATPNRQNLYGSDDFEITLKNTSVGDLTVTVSIDLS